MIGMPPQQQNSYDFILNSSPKPPSGPSLGGSKIGRVLVAVVGAVILIIVAVTINSFLSSSGKEQDLRLIEVAKSQTELIRVANLATVQGKSKDLNTRIFAVNTRASLESSTKETQALLVTRGLKQKNFSKLLAASANPKTDAALDEATKNNRFDETFLKLMEKQLADYQKLLKVAHEGGSPAEKQVLTKSFDNAKLLAIKFSASSTAP